MKIRSATGARAFLAGCAILALGAGHAMGQPQKEDPADALRGPAVKDKAAPSTLVQREMSGALIRLETRPEAAALDLLDLSKEDRAAAERVLADRFAEVSKLLSEHYDLFLNIAAARQGGAGREELAPMIREFRTAAAPLFDQPLEERVAAVLPEGKTARFRVLVDEYKAALASEEDGTRHEGAAKGGNEKDAVAESTAAPKEARTPPTRPPLARVEMNLTLREMGRALRSIVEERRERVDELIKKLDATPEQEARIRAIIREVGGKSGALGEFKEEQRREMMQRILAELTPEQRRAAVERLRRP